MTFDLQLANRRALVTGGTKGVGAAVVETLRDAGAQVVATARSAPSRPAEGVRFLAADLSTAEGASAVAQSVLQQLGGVDILVNVLGGSSAPGGGFAALDDTEWSKELNQNLMPAVRLDRALLPSMIAQGSGVIIHVTSIQRVLPIARVDDRLRCGQGGTVDVQQGPLEGGDAQGNPRYPRFSRLGRNGGGGRTGGAPRGPSRYGLRGRQADHHEEPRRHSARPSRQAEGSRGPHRFSGLAASGFDYRNRVRDRWRDCSDCLNGFTSASGR